MSSSQAPSSSPGAVVYVAVLIGFAGLFSVAGLLRYCYQRARTPNVPPAGVRPRIGPGSVAEVPMALVVPEYEAKTVANPDGSLGLAVVSQTLVWQKR